LATGQGLPRRLAAERFIMSRRRVSDEALADGSASSRRAAAQRYHALEPAAAMLEAGVSLSAL